MTKNRLVVVVSPKLKRRNELTSVVPLSSTEPYPAEAWHVQLDLDVPEPWGSMPRWAKCDMIATVGYSRLTRPYYRHKVTGSRLFWQHCITVEELIQIRAAVAASLGIVIAD